MNTRFNLSRYIPPEAVAVTREGVDAVVYVYKTSAIAYAGKASKPAWHYRYSTVEGAQAKAQEFLDSMARHHAEKIERNTQRKAFKTSLTIGAILAYSWGYDQTNVSFYEVIDVSATGKTVTVRELAHDSVRGSEGFMCEQRVPVPGHYIGEPTKKIVRPGYGSGGDFVPMKHGSATRWSGTPCYCSWYA